MAGMRAPSFEREPPRPPHGRDRCRHPHHSADQRR
jgi:hypothetical protein